MRCSLKEQQVFRWRCSGTEGGAGLRVTVVGTHDSWVWAEVDSWKLEGRIFGSGGLGRNLGSFIGGSGVNLGSFIVVGRLREPEIYNGACFFLPLFPVLKVSALHVSACAVTGKAQRWH